MQADEGNDRLARLLDLVEQVAAVLLLTFLIYRIWPDPAKDRFVASAVILIASEGMVVLFLLIRRQTTHLSFRLQDWIVAAAGTFLPMAVIGDDQSAGPLFAGAERLSIFLLIVGMTLHVSAKISLNRSFGLVAANRGVKVYGAYRYVRHPMYAGYILTQAGFLVAAPVLWNFVVYALCWTALILRIRAEERILINDDAYKAFSARVRFRLVPGIY